MATFAVVEHFDVLEQIGAGLLSCAVAYPVHALALEHTEEALDDGIVVTVADADVLPENWSRVIGRVRLI